MLPPAWIERYRWGWCLLSAVLMVGAMPPFACSTLGWIALVPAWWVATRSESVRRHPLRHGYVLGLVLFAGMFWWISNVTAVGTIFIVLYMALYPGLWFLLVGRLLPGADGAGWTVLPRALGAAALWVTLEWWRSWFLTGFDWNELGASQGSSLVFRQLAAFGGVPLLSFLLVTINVLWAEALLVLLQEVQARRRVGFSLPLGSGLLLVAAGFALGWHHLQRHTGEAFGAPLRFAAIQPDIPQIPYAGGPWIDYQNREDEALAVQVGLSREALAHDPPDLLIWPEATIDQGVFQDRPLNAAVHDLTVGSDGSFLLGSQDFETAGKKLYNCAYLFGPHGDSYAEYRKTRLVVLGEYVPLAATFPWLRHALGLGLDFTPGPGPEVFTLERPVMRFAPFICFEDTLAEVGDSAARLRPDFFVNMSNDGWYRGWFAAWGIRQHLNLARFRCVEHDRPMIRCTNNGISCVIDQDGTVTDRFRDMSGRAIDARGIYRGTLRFYPAQATFHETTGAWIVLLSGAVSAMLGVYFLAFVRESRPSLFRRRPVL